MFFKKLNELSDRSKFAVAVGSRNANPQDCEMFESPTTFKSTTPFEDMEDCEFFENVTAAFVSDLHVENPSGVTPDLLANVWIIEKAGGKNTVKVTTQLSKQDSNTSLSRKFGKMIEF